MSPLWAARRGDVSPLDGGPSLWFSHGCAGSREPERAENHLDTMHHRKPPTAPLRCSRSSSSASAMSLSPSSLDYIQPRPVTCALARRRGCPKVCCRATCASSVERARGVEIGPECYYCGRPDPQADDGNDHLFAEHLVRDQLRFNPGWLESDAYHAVSENGAAWGLYERVGFIYDSGGSHKGTTSLRSSFRMASTQSLSARRCRSPSTIEFTPMVREPAASRAD